MKKILYLGLEPPKRSDAEVIHCPLIEVIPLEQRPDLSLVTHIIATSKTAVRCLKGYVLEEKAFLSVGKGTTRALEQAGAKTIYTATEECQEGVIALIERLELTNPHFFWGHSSRSRTKLSEYLVNKGYPVTECVLYETVYKKPNLTIPLAEIDEIHFTSPSTVEAFYHFFGSPPKRAALSAQGKITQGSLLLRADL